MNKFLVLGTIIFVLFVSVSMIVKGVRGLKNRKIKVTTLFFGTKALSSGRPLYYEGKLSVAPSIVHLVFGALIPLVFVSAAVDYFLGIEYSMPIILGVCAIISVFCIFFFTYAYKNKLKK